MEKLISARFNIQSVPESYILSPETRPGKLIVPLLDALPTIDLEKASDDRMDMVQQIMKASQELGFFQVLLRAILMLL